MKLFLGVDGGQTGTTALIGRAGMVSNCAPSAPYTISLTSPIPYLFFRALTPAL